MTATRLWARGFELLNLAFSLGLVASIAWYHGLSYQPGRMAEHGSFLFASVAFYVALFVVRGVRATSGLAYLRENALEAWRWCMNPGSPSSGRSTMRPEERIG